jgi:putative ATPase
MSPKAEPPTLFGGGAREPLAARMRPRSLDQFLGQEHLLGEGQPLRLAIDGGDVHSMILWGPPGCGKTTLARLLATQSDKHFVPFSAVTEGIPRVREVIAEAKQRSAYEGRGTILFCDEIHRFNKAQQDAFLPWVEDGVVTLVGATTENPSFEINSALLSRVQVFVLQPLEERHLDSLVERALQIEEARAAQVAFTPEARATLVRHADGDARKVLNMVEQVIDVATRERDVGASEISTVALESILARRMPRYDKAGEEHYNLISALHKAVRGSDVDGALYWLARMIDGGEDVLYIARRVVRMAVEDIGLADPRALSVALAAKDAYHFLGSPEGDLAVAQAVVYLATAPKSNHVLQAWGDATSAAREHPNEPVPLHLRNAPTSLMKELRYGAGYRYDHAEGGFAPGQVYLPEALQDQTWYDPSGAGFEKTIKERLDWLREQRTKATDQEPER